MAKLKDPKECCRSTTPVSDLLRCVGEPKALPNANATVNRTKVHHDQHQQRCLALCLPGCSPGASHRPSAEQDACSVKPLHAAFISPQKWAGF